MNPKKWWMLLTDGDKWEKAPDIHAYVHESAVKCDDPMAFFIYMLIYPDSKTCPEGHPGMKKAIQPCSWKSFVNCRQYHLERHSNCIKPLTDFYFESLKSGDAYLVVYGGKRCM